ncbi:hypothetical protein EGR_05777 [Echinococcus granulosus]|uniref:Uncharacterized protein n=1 Tax=Echinococcus granulosus TaxID=6210 RepID=W6UEC1_ECHGR|nr:hypothetical protein EGR_05777 [Echinococcus granulosus]EUB59423.1 hypothetical protein EGR_05777 [Echinococcus granulosus]
MKSCELSKYKFSVILNKHEAHSNNLNTEWSNKKMHKGNHNYSIFHNYNDAVNAQRQTELGQLKNTQPKKIGEMHSSRGPVRYKCINTGLFFWKWGHSIGDFSKKNLGVFDALNVGRQPKMSSVLFKCVFQPYFQCVYVICLTLKKLKHVKMSLSAILHSIM